MRTLQQAFVIAEKELRAEWRSKEVINSSLSFSVVILLLFSFAIDPSAEQISEIAGGLLWLVFAFAGALILNRSFARELGNDCLDALLSTPLSPAALFLGKTFANYFLLLAVECFCLPVFAIFYNVTITRQLNWLILTLVLATWSYSVIGTMFSALTVNLRLREVMLPMLVYPVMIPALMAAIQLTIAFVAGRPLDQDLTQWFKMLVGFDVIFTSVTLVLIEIVLKG